MNSSLVLKLQHIANYSSSVSNELLVLLDECFARMSRVHSPSLAMTPFALEIINEIADRKMRRRVREAAKRLEKKKMVKIKKQGNQSLVQLTNKGKMEVIRNKIIMTRNQLPTGVVCMVVFDIPESVKITREMFRQFIKNANFRQLQKSVWISEYDVMKDMSLLIQSMKAAKWISVFNAFRT